MITDKNAAGYGWADICVTLRSRWRLVVLIGFFVFLAGAVISWKEPVIYESSSEILVDHGQSESPVIRMSTEVRPTSLNPLRRAKARLDSDTLLLKVVESGKLADRWKIENRAEILRQLRRKIEVKTEETHRIIRITVRDISPEHSSNLANSVAQTLVDLTHKDARKSYEDVVQNLNAELRFRNGEKQRIENRLRKLNRSGETSTVVEAGEVSDLRNQLIEQTLVIRSLEAKHQLSVVALQNISSGVSILRHSVVEESLPMQSRASRSVFYSVFGLLIGATLTCLLSIEKLPIKIASRIARELDPLMMGYVPIGIARDRNAEGLENSNQIEAYRDLRNRIHRIPARDSSVILFIPRGENAGAAEVVANTAKTIAEAGQTVLVIDSDFRSPQLHDYFEAARHPGLGDYLSGEMRVEETIIKTRTKNLWVMPAGPLPADPSGLVNVKRMDDLFWEIRSRFDYLLVTAPPIHQCSDTGAISSLADHVIAVTPYHTHKIEDLRETKQTVEACHARLSGVILTKPEPIISKEAPANKESSTKMNQVEFEGQQANAAQSTVLSEGKLPHSISPVQEKGE